MSFSLRQKNKPLKDPKPGINLRVIVISLCVLTVAGIFYAYSSVRALNTSYQVSRALEVQHELMETGRRLKVELNNLRSMERLEEQAGQLGLAKPTPAQLRRIK